MHKRQADTSCVHRCSRTYTHSCTQKLPSICSPTLWQERATNRTYLHFQRRLRFCVAPSVNRQTHAHKHTQTVTGAVFVGAGLKKKEIIQQMTMTQWENKRQALTGGIRLWMTIPVCSPPLPLPRSSMNAIIICHTNRSNTLQNVHTGLD